VAGFELGNAVRLDVEANDGEDLAEFDGQRQADVAEADDGDFFSAGDED
jgi:hypothetical protein